MSHADQIYEIARIGDEWRIVLDAAPPEHEMAAEIFPSGVPQGIAVAGPYAAAESDATTERSTYVITGLHAPSVRFMAQDYAAYFRDAGLVQQNDGHGPPAGYIRTWQRDDDVAWDVPADEAVRMHVDSWIEAWHGEWTDPLADVVLGFRYENGKTYGVALSQVREDTTVPTLVLNEDNELLIPADDGFEPVFNLRNCPRTTQLRRELEAAAQRMHTSQSGWEYLDTEFRRIVDTLSRMRWTDPSDAFPDGLGAN